MLSKKKIQYLANLRTPDRRRAEYMGWQFGKAEVIENLQDSGYIVRMVFRCVCGTNEYIAFKVDDNLLMFAPEELIAHELDVARRLRNGGSFSRDHLLKDGYTLEQVEEFERKAQEFDARG